MRVLVVYGTKNGSTTSIATRIANAITAQGFDVDLVPTPTAVDVRKYGAVVVGGALYAGRWVADVRRFVLRNGIELRNRHVWFFSSGPLDASADTTRIEPTPQVAELMAYVGAHAHATFGGALAPDAHGLIASAMAKTRAGDWRNMERIAEWADEIAAFLATAPPRELQASYGALPPRGAPASLCLLAGLSAWAGGVALVLRPDGSLIGLPLSVLQHSPFRDFFIPGLLLCGVVGVGNVVSGFLHLQRAENAPMFSAVSGMSLVIWMIVEMVMLRSFHPLQVAYVLLGIAIVGASFRAVAAMFPKVTSEKPVPLVHR